MDRVSLSDYEDSINLLGRVLINGCSQLFKRGLDRNYVEISEVYPGIKGKIDFQGSLNKNLFRQGKSLCIYDQFEVNILQNQLIKATLLRLSRISSLDKGLKHEVRNLYWRFQNIKDINLQLSLFSKVGIHRNNSFYDFILKICKLITENCVFDEESGDYTFKEFIGSDKAMANLFESFVRNFYKREQHHFKVDREDIRWCATPIENSSYGLLPKMQTDITLESDERKIIIEAKYYANALSSRFDAEKLNSNNLFQLYSYLRNIESKEGHPLNKICEGILLYPSVNYTLNESFEIDSHLLKIKTIDMNKDWQEIKKGLLSIIDLH